MRDKAGSDDWWVKGITPKRRWGIGLPERKLPAPVVALADPENTLSPSTWDEREEGRG